MKRQPLGPILGPWFKSMDTPPPDAQDCARQVMARVPQIHQRGPWWPLPTLDRPAPVPTTIGPAPARGFTVFSALKFVVAGVIVALFGGFLLTGILNTQQSDEVAPAAMTASPESSASSEPSEAPAISLPTDILPGVELTMEEVEPGVYRVIDDGVRDLASQRNISVVAGHDGGIWLLRQNRFFRLGDEGHGWATQKPEVGDFEVAPNGTVWTQQDGGIHSFDGEEWTTHDVVGPVKVTSDGRVWARWRDDPEDAESVVFGYLGADGWRSVEWPDELPDGPSCPQQVRCVLLVSDRGEVWALAGSTKRDYVQHFVDGAWRTYDGAADPRGTLRNAAVGADGTLWGSTRAGFFRFDGTEWTTFEWHDGFLGDVFGWGEFHVAPDGSLWVAPQPGECGRDRCSCDHGVTRFDGISWGRYLPDRCVEAFDITADGTVWLLASEEPGQTFDRESQAWAFAGDAMWDLYVITHEAMEATE